MTWDVAQAIVPYAVSLLIILSALTISPAQLAARSILRQTAGGPLVRSRAPALVVGVGVGASLAAVWAGALFGAGAAMTVALLLVLALLATIDLAWRWLSVEWCGLIACVGAAEAILSGNVHHALLGAVAGGALLCVLRMSFLLLRGIEALGLGDVWLAAAIGCVVGPEHIIWVLGAAACLGLLLHYAAPSRDSAERGVAFGAHICLVTPFFLGL